MPQVSRREDIDRQTVTKESPNEKTVQKNKEARGGRANAPPQSMAKPQEAGKADRQDESRVEPATKNEHGRSPRTYDPRTLGAQCDDCPRFKAGKIPVPSEGPKQGAKYVILGQDPGASEERLGRPFIGATGILLFKLWESACQRAGVPLIRREDVFITNAALCAPSSHSERESRLAVSRCHPRLLRELSERTSADAGILALGKNAYYALTGKTKGVGKYLGFHIPIDIENVGAKEKALRRNPKGTRVAAR